MLSQHKIYRVCLVDIAIQFPLFNSWEFKGILINQGRLYFLCSVGILTFSILFMSIKQLSYFYIPMNFHLPHFKLSIKQPSERRVE